VVFVDALNCAHMYIQRIKIQLPEHNLVVQI